MAYPPKLLLPTDGNGNALQVARMVDTAVQKLAITNVGPVSSTAITSGRVVVLVNSDQDCYVRISLAGTAATTSDTPIWSKTPTYLQVREGDIINVLGSAPGGGFWITQCE